MVTDPEGVVSQAALLPDTYAKAVSHSVAPVEGFPIPTITAEEVTEFIVALVEKYCEVHLTAEQRREVGEVLAGRASSDSGAPATLDAFAHACEGRTSLAGLTQALKKRLAEQGLLSALFAEHGPDFSDFVSEIKAAGVVIEGEALLTQKALAASEWTAEVARMASSGRKHGIRFVHASPEQATLAAILGSYRFSAQDSRAVIVGIMAQ